MTVQDTRSAWDEWMALFANRDEVADYYAGMLRVEELGDPIWSEVNAAIVRRWSLSALVYIKTKAWKLAGGGAA